MAAFLGSFLPSCSGACEVRISWILTGLLCAAISSSSQEAAKGPANEKAQKTFQHAIQSVREHNLFASRTTSRKPTSKMADIAQPARRKLFRTASNCRIGRQLNPRLPRWWRMLTDQPRWQLAHYQFAEETGGPRAGLEDRSGAVGTGAPRTLFRGLSLPQRNVKIGVLQRFPR